MKILAIFLFIYVASAEVAIPDVDIPEVDLDDFAAIKDKCDKAGGAGTYDRLKASKDSFQSCITGFANASVVQNEVEEAKKTGSMDEVFGKYCAKRPKLATCVETFTDKLRPCLNDEEKKALNVTLDVLKQLGDFICYRDGDRIAMFIAEGGVECIQSRTEGIKSCVNSTFKIEPATVNTNALPSLLIDRKKCDDLGKLQTCVVEELEKCSQSTPANIVDALFKFIKRSACSKKNKRSVHIHSIIKRSAAYLNGVYDPSDVKNHMLDIFRKKCDQNAPDGGFEAFTSASHCVRNKTRDEKLFATPVVTFKENIDRCVRKLIEKTEACLAEEEKYWPKFYLQLINSLIDFLYANKDTLLNLNRPELINCFQNFKQISQRRELLKCIQVPNPHSLKKDDVCEKLKGITGCFSNKIKNKCIFDVTINKLLDDYVEAATAPCKQ